MMTKNELGDIVQAFCEDCRRRMLVVGEIVQDGAPFNSMQLDQLHQEFDTLYGGARAVHLPELEHFFRNMARHARYLRNHQSAVKEVDQQDWQLLLTNIAAWLRCDGESPDCMMHGGRCDLAHLLHGMKNNERLREFHINGEAK